MQKTKFEAWEVGKMIEASPMCDVCRKRMRPSSILHYIRNKWFVCNACVTGIRKVSDGRIRSMILNTATEVPSASDLAMTEAERRIAKKSKARHAIDCLCIDCTGYGVDKFIEVK